MLSIMRKCSSCSIPGLLLVVIPFLTCTQSECNHWSCQHFTIFTWLAFLMLSSYFSSSQDSQDSQDSSCFPSAKTCSTCWAKASHSWLWPLERLNVTKLQALLATHCGRNSQDTCDPCRGWRMGWLAFSLWLIIDIYIYTVRVHYMLYNIYNIS